MTLIPVVVKRNRWIASVTRFSGGLLHLEKHYYVRRIHGNCNPMKALFDIKEELLKKAA